MIYNLWFVWLNINYDLQIYLNKKLTTNIDIQNKLINLFVHSILKYRIWLLPKELIVK